MARYPFGGGISDWTFGTVTVSGTDGLAQVAGGVGVTFWSAETGGIQFTDLLDPNLQAVSSVTSSDGTDGRAVGQIPPFSGPDGIRLMWAQAGTGPRAIIKTTAEQQDYGVILPPLSAPGTVTAPATGRTRLYNDTDVTLQIVAVRASAGVAPTTAALVVDVNRNGTTIFSTQSNRPSIAIGANTSGKVVPLDVVVIAPGDYLTADVDAGAGAGDLVVQVLAARAAS
ncbi:MAG TPA: hypothetical protein VIQ30_17035 [Pseudonocardia sp.]